MVRLCRRGGQAPALRRGGSFCVSVRGRIGRSARPAPSANANSGRESSARRSSQR